MPELDLAVIGAGCAGLSLAARLADQAPDLRVALIDPRTGFSDDRTWCFWSDGSAPLTHLACARWPTWRFSDAHGEHAIHSANGLEYVMVRGADFYADALSRLRGTAVQTLFGRRAGRLAEARDHVRIVLEDGARLSARHVIDTRPDRTAPALMHQVFLGQEIETDHDAFDPAQAGLMEGLSAADGAVSFAYTLPVSARRALVEWTVFARTPCAPETLRPALDAHLARQGLTAARVLRTERGVLPMGAAEARPGAGSRIVKAGAGGGAVRAATGYAFQRIQHWAEACTARVIAGEAPVGHPPEPAVRAAMDRIFLKALNQRPENGAAFFMALARHVPPAALVRFMSDGASPADLLRVVTALPPTPFLAALAAPVRRSQAGLLEEQIA